MNGSVQRRVLRSLLRAYVGWHAWAYVFKFTADLYAEIGWYEEAMFLLRKMGHFSYLDRKFELELMSGLDFKGLFFVFCQKYNFRNKIGLTIN